MNLKKIEEKWIGKDYPVWWDTNRPYILGEGYPATVLKVIPYNGRYTDSIACIFRLSAPNLRKGYTEMTIPKIELKHREPRTYD